MKTTHAFVHALASFCLSGISISMLACAPIDDAEIIDDQDDGVISVVAADSEENIGETAQPLISTGFSTFVGGPDYDDRAKPAVDGAGNVYVAGSVPVTGRGRDVFLWKHSPSGVRTKIATIGSTLDDEFADIAVDSAGNSYLLLKTITSTSPVIQICKVNAVGSLIYVTTLSGSGDNQPRGIAVDPAGSVYVTGKTTSSNFYTTAGAFQSVHRGGADAFVTKLNANGTIVYSTLLGGDGDDDANDIAVDAAGYAYVVGSTLPPTSGIAFPTTNGAYQQNPGGSWDAFVAEFWPNGSTLYYSTLLGGSSSDRGLGIGVDGAYNAYVTGSTQSGNFPITAGAFRATRSVSTFEDEPFVVKLNDPGNVILYSTYLGAGGALAQSIAVDKNTGKAFVAGSTSVPGFATTTNAFQKSYAGAGDGYLIELNVSGSSSPYATFMGGTSTDVPLGIALDTAGNVFVAGRTDSPSFPTFNAAQSTFGGFRDGFLVKFTGP